MGKLIVRRADIFMAELEGKGDLLKGKHPILVISCQDNNKFSNLINIIPLTSTINTDSHNNVIIGMECGLLHESKLLSNQIQTINKNDILFKIGFINLEKMQEVQKVLLQQLGIKNSWGCLKMYQVYEQKRMEIRMAKCQEDYKLMEQLAEEYLKNLYEMVSITQSPEMDIELEWVNFHIALAKKKNGYIHEAYNVAKESLMFSKTKNSDYAYTCWMIGSICMELTDKFIPEGIKMFEECIEFYDKIGEERYKILSIFNKAKMLKDIPEMQRCIETYKNTKFKIMLFNIGDTEKEEILITLKSELDSML
ncbi:type II toxin-antitoxin system PemK/MazF family toxin [Clostridium sp. FP1]|uniref:type II toxin-antitoxin system PemK/MazF family toxin n=1 Tax=Clostridium sp. FP1 TaxID=2724076 RepID=UPI0013E926EF|nr:type II toxin-antitoxin system PemK/MazF family toxin [Clostridium sp. FP1]MBZ9635528.1 type II toxin-antitoxin system PemK/MazF family toxin [Clostridium sp. FP1]